MISTSSYPRKKRKGHVNKHRSPEGESGIKIKSLKKEKGINEGNDNFSILNKQKCLLLRESVFVEETYSVNMHI